MIDQLTCEETFRKLDDYLDRELSERECRLVEQHLEVCRICRAEFEFEASLWNQVRAKLQRVTVPSSLRERVALILKDQNCPEPDEK